MDERSTLLPKEEQHTSKLPYDPLVATRRAATGGVVVMAAAALIFGVGFVVQERTAVKAPEKSNFYKKNPGEILIYKRTHPSADSAEECKFFVDILGASCTYTGTTPKSSSAFTELDSTDESYCAHRSEALIDKFCYHNIRDSFKPEGEAESWVKVFNELHSASFEYPEQWDQFMTLSTGLYTPYLGKHLARFKEKGIPYKTYMYENPWDNEIMYVLMTYNPSTGNVIEIHGSSVAMDADATGPEGLTDDGDSEDYGLWEVRGMAPAKESTYEAKSGLSSSSSSSYSYSYSSRRLSLSGHPESGETTLKSEWKPLPEHACEVAVSTGLSKAHLEETWELANQETSSYAELPLAMVVKVSHPSMDVHETASWMSDNAGIEFTIKEGSSDKKSKSGMCRMAHASIKKWSSVGTVSVIYVQPMSLHAEDYMQTKAYIEHVAAVHKDRLGEQRGWDRYLDSHIGLIYRDTWLDDIAPTLVENGVRFHAMKDPADNYCLEAKISSDCGSIWSEGTAGLAIEMHSFFKPSTADADGGKNFFSGEFKPTYMDFCNAETNSGAYSFAYSDLSVMNLDYSLSYA